MNKQERDNQNGEITVEATFVMLAAIAVVFMIINIAFAMYNMQIASSVANQAANDIANIYATPYKDPFSAIMREDYFLEVTPYRYWGNGLENKNKNKARWYACYNVWKNEMGKEYNTKYNGTGEKVKYTDQVGSEQGTGYYPGITVEVTKNAIKQRELVVKVNLKYPVFTMNPFIVFEFDPYYTVGGEGRAICVDPIHDMNCTKMYSEIYNRVVGMTATTTIINNLCSAVNKVIDIIKSF